MRGMQRGVRAAHAVPLPSLCASVPPLCRGVSPNGQCVLSGNQAAEASPANSSLPPPSQGGCPVEKGAACSARDRRSGNRALEVGDTQRFRNLPDPFTATAVGTTNELQVCSSPLVNRLLTERIEAG